MNAKNRNKHLGNVVTGSEDAWQGGQVAFEKGLSDGPADSPLCLLTANLLTDFPQFENLLNRFGIKNLPAFTPTEDVVRSFSKQSAGQPARAVNP